MQRAAVQPGDDQRPAIGQRGVDVGARSPTERLRTASRRRGVLGLHREEPLDDRFRRSGPAAR